MLCICSANKIGTLVYVYAFMNWDSRIAYKSLFTWIFKVLETTSQTVIKFPYIYNVDRGIRTIGLDMCKKQAGGMYIYI
jgi:hypothetical protein